MLVGDRVFYRNQECEIKEVLEDGWLLIEELTSWINHKIIITDIDGFKYSAPEAELEEARRREKEIKSLAELELCPKKRAVEAAAALGMSWRQVYTLLKRYKQSGWDLESLVPQQSSGGRGKSRLDPAVEEITTTVIKESPAITLKQTIAEITERCAEVNLQPPSYVTVWKRMKQRRC